MRVGWDPFSAAERGDLDSLKAMINVNTVNASDWGRRTVLHIACTKSYTAIVEWLLHFVPAIDLNARDMLLSTPLHAAAMAGFDQGVDLLLSAGANPVLPNTTHLLPLHMASFTLTTQSMALLLAADASAIHARESTFGWLPVHCTVRNGNRDGCELLLRSGSQVDVDDDMERTPLCLSLIWNRQAIAGLLMDHGAQLDRVVVEEQPAKDVITRIPDWAFQLHECRSACRSATWAVLNCARCRSQLMGVRNGKDVLRLIARLLWMTRNMEHWTIKD